jgi:Domain of unknown function (DUF4190)
VPPGEYPPTGQYAPPAQYGPAGQYPPAGQYGPPAGYNQPARTNPLSIAALVCGLVQFLFGLVGLNILLAIPAIICGAIGLKQTNVRGERGRGMAIAGLVLGILGVLYFILVVLVIVHYAHTHHLRS